MATKSHRLAAPAKKPARKPAAKAAKKAPKTRAVAMPEGADLDVATADDGDLCGLSIRSARFVNLYLSSFNATQAYLEAGFNAKSTAVARACAARLLTSANVRAYLAKRSKAMFERAEEDQDRAMTLLRRVAYADANELVSYVRGACRFCWGKANRYQFTNGEWEAALLKHEEKREKLIEAGKPDPGAMDTKGGTGFLKSREPNEECPECCGEGIGRVVIHDTRHLAPAALALYAGVKEGKDGIEIKMHDRMRALELLAKIAKLFDDAPKVSVQFNVAALEAEYGEVMRRAHERSAAMRRERFGLDDNLALEGRT